MKGSGKGVIREDEFGPTHCAKCGAKFGEPRILARLAGIPVTGDVVYADYEGSVLCELCMDDEVEAQDVDPDPNPKVGKKTAPSSEATS